MWPSILSQRKIWRYCISTESTENVEKFNISFDEHNEIIEEFAERAVEKKYDKKSQRELE